MIYCNKYLKELTNFCTSCDYKFLSDCKVLISGGTGLIGSYLIDALLINKSFPISITCICTDIDSAKERFSYFKDDSRLLFIKGDLTLPFIYNDTFDYIIHLASFSDAKNYSRFPVETMLMNIIGCKSLLEIAKNSNCKKFLYASSSEIYGTTPQTMNEENFGEVNCLDIRSCYNESKRASETLCVSYASEYNVNPVIARFGRPYGPTMLYSDSKALSQFLKNALNNEDIVLKSSGTQKLSYCYISDTVSAIFTLLKSGERCNAYNISNPYDVPCLKEIAQMVANLNNLKVITCEQTEEEKRGYSRATQAILPTDKLEKLGWKPQISMEEGIKNTFEILKDVYN